VTVRYEKRARSGIEVIERLLVRAPSGERVPLAQLADIRTVEAPAQISRENGMRRVVIEANVGGRDLGGFVSDVQEALAPVAGKLPPGYYLEYGGQFENQRRAMRQLSVIVPVSLGLILVLLYMALGSVWLSLLVFLNLPFALVGGVIAVAIFRMPLSVSAAVAFIVLLGIAVQNGVILITFFRQLKERGADVETTIARGCDLRFRPLLMTALTTFIGNLPMLYATGSGADVQRPLAVVVNGGLITSSLLTLIVVPTIYSVAYKWSSQRRNTRQAAA
jgi:cobalt-zinc-cadmium resistance protein CzcA